MKLATLKQGGRDGTLVVVSRDLARCQAVGEIATLVEPRKTVVSGSCNAWRVERW